MDAKHTRWSPYIPFLIGALGAFIFFGIMTGVVSFRTDESLQVASPEAGIRR